jgi:integrase
VPLSDLTKQTIVDYGRARASEGAGPATLAQDLIYLRGVIQAAAAHWDVPVSVETVANARTVLKDQGLIARSNERDRRPTDDELETLRQYWERPQVRKALTAPMMDIVLFAIASCMRLSEITSIRWADINKKDRTILIRDRKHPSQKTGNSQTVPLLGDAWTIIQRQPETDERIFPFNPASVSANFTRAVLRTRIDDLHFHDTRHHGISLLFEAGYQLQEVALVSGHRDWKQLARYTRIKAKDLHRAE